MCPSETERIPSREPTTTTRVPDLKPVFDVLDIDRDGKISADDLRTFYAGFSSGANITSDEDIGSMMSVADLNKDGFVELGEFERVLGGFRPVNGVMTDAFKVMDKDGDGKVGFDDLRSYMNWAGLSVTDEDIRAMIRLAGTDGKDGIPYEGLLKILALDFAG
ncbi:PREDICTED: squidulin [Nelumbo nucifera]|uniref:Squidulin n=2 Tax=Nelumbo nucifera TaxID=4432 RepID=A0A1U7ZZC1_NELNU|nr:PREDICTED: squidulin [Nelumbo nucifera]DAD38300.1 TPA_asm: hypothetical protein HUJ06_008941 [Nelumbo nucifera]